MRLFLLIALRFSISKGAIALLLLTVAALLGYLNEPLSFLLMLFSTYPSAVQAVTSVIQMLAWLYLAFDRFEDKPNLNVESCRYYESRVKVMSGFAVSKGYLFTVRNKGR